MPRAKRGFPQSFLNTTLLWETDSCIFWPFARNNEGYAVMKYKGTRIYVSIFVCQTIHGPKPTFNHQTAHSCGNGHLGCINKRHLRWATGSENTIDAIKHGRR